MLAQAGNGEQSNREHGNRDEGECEHDLHAENIALAAPSFNGPKGPFVETARARYLIECADRTEALAVASEVPSSPGLVVEALPVAQM